MKTTLIYPKPFAIFLLIKAIEGLIFVTTRKKSPIVEPLVLRSALFFKL